MPTDDDLFRIAKQIQKEKNAEIARKKRLAKLKKAKKQEREKKLQGKNLIAWKLARNSASNKCKEESRLRSYDSGMPFWKGGSSIRKYRKHDYELHSIPKKKYMKKTKTGDIKFLFFAKDKMEKHRDKAIKKVIVTVVDYGSEYRVEEVVIEE